MGGSSPLVARIWSSSFFLDSSNEGSGEKGRGGGGDEESKEGKEEVIRGDEWPEDFCTSCSVSRIIQSA